MRPNLSDIQFAMESVKFFCWIIGSIFGLSVTLLGIYLRMYITERLREHTDTIAAIVAENYVRRDVYQADMRRLEGLA